MGETRRVDRSRTDEALLALVDALPAMVALWNRELYCEFANRAYVDWFGLEPEQVVGKHISAVLGPQILELNRPYVEAALRGEEQVFEREIPGVAGGPARHAQAQYVPRSRDGAIVGFIALVVDITDRRAAESALRQSENELREAQRLAGIGSWEWDPATNVTRWSNELFRIFDRDPSLGAPNYEELAGYHSPEAFELLGRLVKRALATGEPYELDTPFRRRDGSIAWAHGRGEAVRDAAGKIVGLRGTTLDITSRKEAELALKKSEAELRESEARYALIAANTQDVIWLYDMQRRAFDYVSASVERLAGYTVAEALAQDLTDLVPVAGVAATEASATHEGVLRRKDGGYVAIEVVVTPVRGERDRVTHLQGVTRDISARKRLEGQVLQLQRLESVGRLAGGVAHDFNNLLTVIIGQVEFALAATEPQGDQAEALREALAAANRSAELTRQLLAFARRQAIDPRLLDLNEEIENALSMLRRLVGETVSIVWEPKPRSWAVKLDHVQVHQLLANLVVNARDALGGSGTVRVATSNVVLDADSAARHPGATPGSYVELAVSDDGTGMSPEVRARAFEPFFTTKDPGQGTGLGLSIVYGIVTQNGGHVDVESEPGVGTTVRVRFPRHDDARAVSVREPEPLPRGTETVLVVEDEGAVLKLTRDMLGRLGYRVLSATAPRDAIELARTAGDVDLVLTDVLLPQMSGRELVRELRAARKDVPFLYMTAFAEGALDAEPTGPVLHKPFTLAGLARAVREALARRPTA